MNVINFTRALRLADCKHEMKEHTFYIRCLAAIDAFIASRRRMSIKKLAYKLGMESVAMWRYIQANPELLRIVSRYRTLTSAKLKWRRLAEIRAKRKERDAELRLRYPGLLL